MNCEQMLNLIAQAITLRPTGNGKRYLILIRNNTFICAHYDVVHLDTEVIGIFNGSELAKGLTPNQWNQLRTRCGRYIKEHPECPIVQKQ